jgi:hypothetical protein
MERHHDSNYRSDGKDRKALVERLASRGVPVRTLVRDLTRAEVLPHRAWSSSSGISAGRETLAPALAGIRTAYLLSAADPDQVRMHGNFIEAAARAGVRHVVRQSVRGAAPHSPVKLARWHATSHSSWRNREWLGPTCSRSTTCRTSSGSPGPFSQPARSSHR